MRSWLLLGLLTIFTLTDLTFAASGKITGTVIDSKTREPLIGVNIIVQGTSQGASTNVDGYYVILDVSPGTYTLKVSMIGYATQVIENVRVNIDQTTNINVALVEKSVQTKEVVVVAQTPVIQKDVAASRVNLDSKEIQNLPVTSVSSVVGLQAGIQSGLVIRGGSATQTGFMVNGMMLNDPRDQTPFTGISYTSISEVQIQTGGFSAEYGNIRSGLVNVVTSSGDKHKYTLNIIAKISPPTQKHFGIDANSRDSYWIRPYVEPGVAMYGTQAINPATGKPYWDAYTQSQYPQWAGWIAWQEAKYKNPNSTDPYKGLTPLAAQQLFLWQHRKNTNITNPDYILDASVGGPVPVISDALGNLRFFASYRATQTEYFIPLATQGVNDFTSQLKLTSDIGQGKKLMVQGMLAHVNGTNDNNSGLPGYFSSPVAESRALDRVSYIDARIFSNDYWAPTSIDYFTVGGKYTQVLSPTAYFDVEASAFGSKYHTDPGLPRDTNAIYNFGGYYFNEAPLGFQTGPSTAIDGFRMSVGFSNSRDSSKVTVYNLKFKLQDQIDKYNEINTGFEFHYTDNNVNSASVDVYLPNGRYKSTWHTFPIRAALYAQDKLEFEGMIATLGLRLDYSDPNGYWYDFSHYPAAFQSYATPVNFDTMLVRVKAIKQLDLSPRLAISFPISVNSKLYFNYGHFRQMPTPDDLYLIRRFSDNNAVTRVANPNAPLEKTIAYELGYEQNILDQILVRLAGYYKDNSLQTRYVNYQSQDNKVNYNIAVPNNYSDTRGFEVTLTKNRGNWVQGFINYTYDVSTSGNFGFGTYYQNPAQQRRYEATTTSNYQNKPLPQPYARANIDFFTPSDIGPKLGGISLLGDWRFSFISTWNSGPWLTWSGGATVPGVSNNVEWTDFWNTDLRITKSLNFAGIELRLFCDISNLFNFKYMSPYYGFYDGNDFNLYMESLHLPAGVVQPSFGYVNIPGNDKPGDYRKGAYHSWSEIQSAAPAQRDQWIKDKAYIDMPNLTYSTFLNPRQIFWGIQVTMAIND
jgi:hypothetical protein